MEVLFPRAAATSSARTPPGRSTNRASTRSTERAVLRLRVEALAALVTPRAEALAAVLRPRVDALAGALTRALTVFASKLSSSPHIVPRFSPGSEGLPGCSWSH